MVDAGVVPIDKSLVTIRAGGLTIFVYHVDVVHVKHKYVADAHADFIRRGIAFPDAPNLIVWASETVSIVVG